MNFDLSTLNKEQLAPVLDTEGAVLVTAGAGSGKTRLLTHRIAYIIAEGKAERYNILAITFTNKAANEMRERLSKMVDRADEIWIFTFHALCVRILRKFIGKIEGFNSNFSIYGENEKSNAVKRILKAFSEKGKIGDVSDYEKNVVFGISKAKEQGLTPDEYLAVNKFIKDIDVIYEVYKEYEIAKKNANALDYDDLLLYARDLLKNDAEAREYYQKKFKYIHIDEFQDTNAVQYEIAALLAGGYGNIFAVGDEDQSIYGWRGADFRNIFNFQKDFNCKVYKLEQNYRSTQNILDVANKVIANNTTRLDKVLWTSNDKGAEVECYRAKTDREEVNYVIKNIARQMQLNNYSYNDFAILMRVNSLSRPFEESLLAYNVPYRVYGGFKFYERKEIKDILAYMKLMVNPSDIEALLRIVNFPKRGIGDATVGQLMNYSAVTGISLYDAIVGADKNEDLPAKITKKLSNLSETLKCFENAHETGASVAQLGKYIVKVLNLKDYYGGDDDENVNRRMNIKELLSGMEEFDKNNGGTLEDYLQSISLYSDTDEEDNASSVTISTVHSAKGLEFKVVFIVGAEEGIFPAAPRAEEGDDIEEERRLMYVAVTRAMEKLFITYTDSRFRFNKVNASTPSRFLQEAGFKIEKPREQIEQRSAYGGYGSYGGYSKDYSRNNVYNGERSYSKTSDDRYNREEMPVYSSYEAPKASKPAAKKDFSKFCEGARVVHKKFGYGTITAIKGSGDNTYAEVFFDKLGKLNLMLSYAPLEIAD